MSEWSMEGQMQAANEFSTACMQWMRSAGVEEMSIEIESVGTRATAHSRALRPSGVMRRPRWEENTVPREVVSLGVQLRVAMAQPGGGAWTKGTFSMKKDDYRLISDFDYDHEPDLTPPYTAHDVAEEPRLFPRDPRATPAWMTPAS